MAGRVVIHLDMDAFYASVEQRDRPELQGRPVVIGADPQGGQGRGVVAAASYEAREHGVHSAQPISRAYRNCPYGVYLRPRHGYYAEVSDQVFELVEDSVDVLEQVSIDEAYAEVTSRCQGSFDQARALAEALKRRIQAELDLTCSIGLGPNKLVAKIASDLDKPDGLTVIPPSQVQEIMGPMSATAIPGVGPKTYQALREHGIETVAELARADPDRMQALFGSWGPGMVARAQGKDPRPVDPSHERKSVGAETTFRQDVTPADARARLEDVVDEVVARLAKTERQGRTVTLKVRTAPFETFTRARTLPVPTDDREAIERVAGELWEEAEPEEKIRLIGLRISGLDPEGPRQTTLDKWPADALGEAPRPRPPGRPLWRFGRQDPANRTDDG